MRTERGHNEDIDWSEETTKSQREWWEDPERTEKGLREDGERAKGDVGTGRT